MDMSISSTDAIRSIEKDTTHTQRERACSELCDLKPQHDSKPFRVVVLSTILAGWWAADILFSAEMESTLPW
jgi:hypothetical protein